MLSPLVEMKAFCFIPGTVLSSGDIAMGWGWGGDQTKILVLFEHMSQKVRYLIFGGDKCCREIQSRKRG